MIRTCAHTPCGSTFDATRSHHAYCSEECKWQAHIARNLESPSQRVEERESHPLQDVREGQEAADAEKALWSAAIYAEIVRILQVRGSFFADDLEPMGIPEEHRNLIGAQLGSLAARHYIHETGRRKSSNPNRKQAKSSVYEFTQKGRAKLAEVSAGVSPQGSGVSPADDARAASADLDEPTALFGSEVGAARPRSAFRDAEAA